MAKLASNNLHKAGSNNLTDDNEDGKLIVDDAYHGFDQTVLQQIRDYINSPQPVKKSEKLEMTVGKATALSGATAPPLSSQGKQLLENWQKYMENGEYLRSIESGEEQNYSFIDGNKNNVKRKNGRVSVLKNCGRNKRRLRSEAESLHSRWKLRQIWSADGNEKKEK